METVVSNTPQKRALDNYRRRLGERGLARFEVLGRSADRELVRSLARRLAQNDPEAARLRAELSRSVAGEPSRKGGILAALRRSPLVGADLKFTREVTPGRNLDL
jgi:transposase